MIDNIVYESPVGKSDHSVMWGSEILGTSTINHQWLGFKEYNIKKIEDEFIMLTDIMEKYP